MWYLGLSDHGTFVRVTALVIVLFLVVALLVGSLALLFNEALGYGIAL